MENLKNELNELRQKKQDLIHKGMQIRDQLVQFENFLKDNKKTIIVEPSNPTLSIDQSTVNLNSKTKVSKQLNAATRKITGIRFENINKKWIKDHIWLYETTVILKMIQFRMLLTVDNKGSEEREIIDIKCILSDVKKCYLNEVAPWINVLTESNNYAHLISALSEYNDQDILRMKLLNKLESEKFVNVKECTEKGGGLIAFVHDPCASKKIYVKFNWRLQLNPQTTSIDHVFDINGIDDEFVNTNEKIFKSFCKRDLKKSELEKLWCDLCIAIKKYKQ